MTPPLVIAIVALIVAGLAAVGFLVWLQIAFRRDMRKLAQDRLDYYERTKDAPWRTL